MEFDCRRSAGPPLASILVGLLFASPTMSSNFLLCVRTSTDGDAGSTLFHFDAKVVAEQLPKNFHVRRASVLMCHTACPLQSVCSTRILFACSWINQMIQSWLTDAVDQYGKSKRQPILPDIDCDVEE